MGGCFMFFATLELRVAVEPLEVGIRLVKTYYFGISMTGNFDLWSNILLNILMMGSPRENVFKMKKVSF